MEMVYITPPNSRQSRRAARHEGISRKTLKLQKLGSNYRLGLIGKKFYNMEKKRIKRSNHENRGNLKAK
jgi:hypothetical protein